MILHRLILTGLFLFLSTVNIFATAPSSIVLDYDVATLTLHIKALHVVNSSDRHFIRKMNISLNGVEQEEHYYTRQKSNIDFNDTITVKAKPSDAIAITLFCSQGGLKSSELFISPQDKTNSN